MNADTEKPLISVQVLVNRTITVLEYACMYVFDVLRRIVATRWYQSEIKEPTESGIG